MFIKFTLSGLLMWFLGSCVPLPAEQLPASSSKYEVDTDWPGIRFQITSVERIIQNTRLMVMVRIRASDQAPHGGTLIGTPPVIPPNVEKKNLVLFRPTPFSLAGATLIQEQTGAQYPKLSSIEPPGVAYFSSDTRAVLQPGQMALLSIQFAVPPPPPPPPPGQAPVPQTVSILLPKAKGPIIHVPMPPLPKG